MSPPWKHCDDQVERKPRERATDRQHLPHNDCRNPLSGKFQHFLSPFFLEQLPDLHIFTDELQHWGMETN